MEPENENLSESRPEVSAFEAALGQLRPRREARFADEVKGRLKDEFSDNHPAPEETTAAVRIPLTHYIRIAQFNAAVTGLLAGLFLGVLLGGAAVFVVMDRLQTKPIRPTPLAAESSYIHVLLKNDASLTLPERALLDQLVEDPRHGRRQTDPRTD